MAKKKRPKLPRTPPEREATERRRLEGLLLDRPRSIEGLRRELALSAHELEAELEHLDRTLKTKSLRIEVEPAECLACSYVFALRSARRFHAPGRCPKCKAERIEEPRFWIEREAL